MFPIFIIYTIILSLAKFTISKKIPDVTNAQTEYNFWRRAGDC